MGKGLFVDQSIGVNAPIKDVWRVITDATYTQEWTGEFRNGRSFRIESNWGINNPVLWKDENGTTLVEGTVTARDEPRLLRFTVFEVGTPPVAVTEKDGITWELTEKAPNTTVVRARQGDFGSIPNGEENYRLTQEIWSRVLPKVKLLAEQS